MGNEGAGLRPSVEALVSERLSIPSYPAGRATSESLNVASAAAIVCAEFRRQQQL
jgi:TrmH family RNA methyltransferase